MTTVEAITDRDHSGAVTNSGALAVAHVAVFCSTSELAPQYLEPSLELVDMISQAGLGIIYGVANVGLMRDVAAHARLYNAHLIGVAIKDSIYPPGPADTLITMPNTAARIGKILELAKGVAVLPGGAGTTNEAATTFEAYVAREFTGPVAVLSAGGHYDSLQRHYAHLSAGGFLRRPLEGAGVLFTPSPADAYAHLAGNINMSSMP